MKKYLQLIKMATIEIVKKILLLREACEYV